MQTWTNNDTCDRRKGVTGGPARVLLVQEDPRTAMLIGEMLRAAWNQGVVIAHAQRYADAAQELRDHGATCVLIDLPGDGDPLAPLEHLRSVAPDVPIIVLSDQPDEETGLAAVKAGAQDYLLKAELNPALVVRAVRYAIERKRSEVELAHQALHDPLTALPNRALFSDRLTVALDRARRTEAPLAVLFLDVDSFKQINDSMGHASGDLLLTVLADRFRQMLRPMDTVARFGGDEFTFLFEELGSEREALLIAERIARSASEPLILDDGEHAVDVSIGIAMVTDPSVAPDQVIRDADAAMYRAKEHGGARLELFNESSRTRATERLELEEALRAAIARSELRVHYQPRVSLAGETGLVGFEALVRWEHPTRGLIAPARVHRGRRGHRPDRPHRRLGARPGPAGRGPLAPVAPGGHGLGQPVGPPARGRRAAGAADRRHASQRRRPQRAVPGGHRGHRAAQSGPDRTHADPSARSGWRSRSTTSAWATPRWPASGTCRCRRSSCIRASSPASAAGPMRRRWSAPWSSSATPSA